MDKEEEAGPQPLSWRGKKEKEVDKGKTVGY